MICAQHMGSRSLWAVVRETYRDAGLKPPRNPRSIGSGAEMLMMISFFIFRVWLSDTSTRSRLWMAQHFVTARKDGCERWHDSEKKWFQTERFKFFWGCHMDDMDGTYRHTCSTPSSHVTCLPFIFTQIWTCFFFMWSIPGLAVCQFFWGMPLHLHGCSHLPHAGRVRDTQHL